MGEKSCLSIKIIKELPFFGEGDSLVNRLRKVSLRGFPQLRIYERAEIEIVKLNPEQIRKNLHTPQPNVYEGNLKRVGDLARLFKEKGIDIFNLDRAYDFEAKDESEEITEWTMIPPIVERWVIPKKANHSLDYEPLIGDELKNSLTRQGLRINSEIEKMFYPDNSGVFDLINDGAHRVHFGYLNGGITIIRIKNITPGFPYYAIPQPYSVVRIMPEANEETTAMKIHVVQSPAQKELYRMFPSGGIKTGTVRPATVGENFN